MTFPLVEGDLCSVNERDNDGSPKSIYSGQSTYLQHSVGPKMHSADSLLVSAIILVWLTLSQLDVTNSRQVGRETDESPCILVGSRTTKNLDLIDRGVLF